MKIVVCTSSSHKLKELSKYFEDIGINVKSIKNRKELTGNNYICISERTYLKNRKSNLDCQCDKFEEVYHKSVVTLEINKDGYYTKEKFTGKVEGFIVLSKKRKKTDIYDWDDIFVAEKTMKSYQEMKEEDLKNSARDIAFVQVITKLNDIFFYDKKINLNFNPLNIDNVISFEPFIRNLFKNNYFYKKAYKNDLFKNIINNILNSGIFIRRASNRKERNYWLPGLNAGIPLTPKKDELHELTFMFHDIMHFIYPDIMVVDDSKESKFKYIISRMMSESFTIVLADMLFIHVLKSKNVKYDFNKRKIYPLFEKIKFDISLNNIDKIEKILWANTCFVLLGSEKELSMLVNDEVVFDNYRQKYQRFFQEDYVWTLKNYKNIVKNHKKNKKMCEFINENCSLNILTTKSSFEDFSIESNYREQVKCIFNSMFKKLKDFIVNKVNYNQKLAYSNAVKRYYSGQLALFFQFDTIYNNLFAEQIMSYLKKELIEEKDFIELKAIYEIYVDKLIKDNYINEYLGKSYKNIYPLFEPFYVFYDKNKEETFKETINKIILGEYDV